VKKEVKNLNRKHAVITFGILLIFCVATCLLSLALYFHQRVNANNDLLSKTLGKSIPRIHYESIISYNSSMRTIIPLFTTASMILFMIGFYLLLLPKVKISALLLALLVLIPMLFPTSIVTATTSSEPSRWYAEVLLLQPRDATGIRGHIYVYDNHVSDSQYSFVWFSLCIMRYDTVWKNLEWLEVGFFQDRGGFWIAAASYIIGKGYVENDAVKLAGEGSTGLGYLDFSIEQTAQPNTFRAYMWDPGKIGIWCFMEATFTIGGDNLCSASSESSDTTNTLNGHYTELKYYANLNTCDWTNVTPHADTPYSVTMSSTNAFYTSGGNYTPPIQCAGDGCGGGGVPRKK